MRITRLYVDLTLSEGEVSSLPSDKAHHIINVLRTRLGEQICLFNNTEFEYLAKIVEITKRNVAVEIIESRHVNKESPLTINLCLAIARGQHMDFSIQKAVELGVKNIIPVISEFSNIKLQDSRKQNKMNHWQNIIISATEQCGRCKLTELQEPILFNEWMGLNSSGVKLILHPNSQHPLNSVEISNNEVTLIIGSEGGFSEQEIEKAIEAGCRRISLGPRILRTETAVVSAVSITQQICGDLN